METITVMNHTLSIIVVAFNEERHIQRLKSSFDNLERPESISLETILIDGGSQDKTVDIAKQCAFSIVHELPGANIPTCRNKGIQEASGDWLAFVDADCEVASDWLKKAQPWLSNNETIIIGWPVYPPENGTWVQRAWHTHWLNKNAMVRSSEPVKHEAFRLITTRNMLLTKTTALQINGFNEKLSTGEDTDFVFRAYTQGLDVIAVPDLHVAHHGEPQNLHEFFRQQLWHANRSSYQTILKESQGNSGKNAVLFSVGFLMALMLALIGLVGLMAKQWWTALLCLPLLAIILLPAILISFRAQKPSELPALALLYAAYGLARSCDLLGIARHKKSWKSR
jgi:glycosyltransferase involved in cell wall biosynthesis